MRILSTIFLLVVVPSCGCGPEAPSGETDGVTTIDTLTSGISPTSTMITTDMNMEETEKDSSVVLDMGKAPLSCDLITQACPEGQKCNPSGFGTGNPLTGEAICVPLEPLAKPLKTPCSLLGDYLDGTDDCELGAVCVSNGDDTGECKKICVVDTDPAIFCEPEEECYDPGCLNCFWGLCTRPCDPREPESCPRRLCLPSGHTTFTCFPDQSRDEGQQGDPCEFLNVCDPGLLCLDGSQVFGCPEDTASCCSAFCSTDKPDPCPHQENGMKCVPWFAESEMPLPQQANLGICSLPTP